MDRNSLIRYFSGEASESEKEALHQWLEEGKQNKDTFIKERICFDATVLLENPPRVSKKSFTLHPYIKETMRIAAAIAVLFLSFSVYDNYQVKQLSKIYQLVSAPAGNRSSILLPDGTHVWINANTTLQYPLAFSKTNREVKLNGEAYFEVVKDSKPFIVKTEKYDVEVLGTTFSVESYAGKENFQTVLYTGKVKLFNAESLTDIFLNPGETAQLVGNSLSVYPTIDVNSYRWKDGLLFIENKAFADIMKLFEKYYNVQIVIENHEVYDLKYQGKLRISDGIDHALRVLQQDYFFKYKREENTNIIYIN